MFVSVDLSSSSCISLLPPCLRQDSLSHLFVQLRRHPTSCAPTRQLILHFAYLELPVLIPIDNATSVSRRQSRRSGAWPRVVRGMLSFAANRQASRDWTQAHSEIYGIRSPPRRKVLDDNTTLESSNAINQAPHPHSQVRLVQKY